MLVRCIKYHPCFTAIFSLFIYISLTTGIAVMIASTIIMGPAAIAGCVVFFLVIPVQVRA
jgi:ATP-binding cassette subfamily C (CFTR/MRP) protein 5/ATP-binding cassette subfamily C (CFTR/MRP) protein 12